MSITVHKPGLMTTVQDRGRIGCASLGVGRAGPMDAVAFQLANALVGNAPDAVALEIGLLGPRLQFDIATTIALTGAELDARIGGEKIAAWRSVRIEAGSTLDCGPARRGAYAYLALAGGCLAAPVLGSASTDVNAGLGPNDGKPVRAGDRLDLGVVARAYDAASSHDLAWALDPRPWFDVDPAHPIRLIRGRHFDALDADSQAALFAQEFRVSADSNRVGLRLDGPRLALAAPLELVSEAIAAGTVQLPSGGQPIALMAEHPTTGGYPRIGQVAAIDLPRLAQRRPGERVRFAPIGIEEAQTGYLVRERELARLCEAIAMRLAR
jgi:antagonist of KipI